LTFDSASEQWIWTIRDRPLPKPRVKPMGYLMATTVIEGGRDKKFLLIPGYTGESKFVS